jgi:integrase
VWVILDGSNEVSTGCSEADRAGAEAGLAAYILGKHSPATTSSRPADILIADVVALYLKERAPHVRRPDFLAATATPIIDWWGDKRLSDIRGVTCRQYVVWRVAKGVSDQTARHDLKTLRAAINHYHREYGPLDAVPAVTLPPKADPRSRYLTRSEAARLLWAARRTEHLRRFILLGLYTGTRRSALLGLKWTTALHSGWIDVEAGILYRKGAGQRSTAKRQPPCKLPDRLLAHVRRWKAKDLKSRIGSVIHVKGSPVESVKRSWFTARVAAKLGADVVPHTLRHSCVTWLLTSGVPAWTVAGFVGMSIEMIDRVYGHHAQGSPKDRANRNGTKQG